MKAAYRISIVWLALSIPLAGCEASEPPPSGENASSSVLERALEEAIAAKVDSDQIELLASAVAKGGITYESYLTAQDRTISCMEAAGFSVTIGDVETVRGATTRLVSFSLPSGMSEQAGLDLASRCESEHFTFVMDAYLNQPWSRESLEALVADHRAAIDLCLAEQGVADSSVLTLAELIEANVSQMVTALDSGGSMRDCLDENGVNWN